MKSTWKRIWQILRSIIGWWVLGTITLIVILSGYTAPWTGFGDYTTPLDDFVRGKTLWDWMQLLIIPVFLWAGAVAVNRSEKEIERQRSEDRAKLEREIATDRQQEAALQSYLDRMADLLLKDKLRTTRNKEVRNVARTRTLTVLRGLDATRKGLVVRFLIEAGLISGEKIILSLDGADLRGVNLSGANLRSANLNGANLEDANLLWTILSGAKMGAANLSGANLFWASLEGTELLGANLERANLEGAFMSDGEIELAFAKSLKGAIMPDGTKHE